MVDFYLEFAFELKFSSSFSFSFSFGRVEVQIFFRPHKFKFTRLPCSFFFFLLFLVFTWFNVRVRVVGRRTSRYPPTAPKGMPQNMSRTTGRLQRLRQTHRGQGRGRL